MSLVVASNLETSNDHMHDHLTPVEAKEHVRSHPRVHERESGPPKSRSSDSQAQVSYILTSMPLIILYL